MKPSTEVPEVWSDLISPVWGRADGLTHTNVQKHGQTALASPSHQCGNAGSGCVHLADMDKTISGIVLVKGVNSGLKNY